jgi:hypothetical protein
MTIPWTLLKMNAAKHYLTYPDKFLMKKHPIMLYQLTQLILNYQPIQVEIAKPCTVKSWSK